MAIETEYDKLRADVRELDARIHTLKAEKHTVIAKMLRLKGENPFVKKEGA